MVHLSPSQMWKRNALAVVAEEMKAAKSLKACMIQYAKERFGTVLRAASMRTCLRMVKIDAQAGKLEVNVGDRSISMGRQFAFFMTA